MPDSPKTPPNPWIGIITTALAGVIATSVQYYASSAEREELSEVGRSSEDASAKAIERLAAEVADLTRKIADMRESSSDFNRSVRRSMRRIDDEIDDVRAVVRLVRPPSAEPSRRGERVDLSALGSFAVGRSVDRVQRDRDETVELASPTTVDVDDLRHRADRLQDLRVKRAWPRAP